MTRPDKEPLLGGGGNNNGSINDHGLSKSASAAFVPVNILSQAGDVTLDHVDYSIDGEGDFIVSDGVIKRNNAPTLQLGEKKRISQLHDQGQLDAPSDVDQNVYGNDGRKVSWGAMNWSQRARYLSYYFPVTQWLPEYDFKSRIIGDLIAGLSIGAMLVPQSMAYAGILGVGPVYGLVTAFFPQIIYFILGHSPVLTCGPEATTSILLVEAIHNVPFIAEIRKNDPTNVDLPAYYLQAAAAISILCGIFTLILGFFRLGFVDGVFSRPVLSGFVGAVGLLLLLDQTPKVLGLNPCTDCEYTHNKIAYLFREIFIDSSVKWQACVVGISCILFLFTFKILKTKFPENKVLKFTPHIFIMVVTCTLISYFLNLGDHIAIIGTTSKGFPTPSLPKFTGGFSHYISPAIILAILGFVETQLINKVMNVKGSSISPNRELVALGTMHIINSFMGGYAAFGSLTRTKVAVSAGCTSQISSIIGAIMILASILFLMPFFSYMPIAVTGGIIWFVATSLLETHDLIFTFKMKQWVDFSLNVVMIFVTFFLGVDIGLFFAFACCLLLVIKQQNKPAVRLLGRVSNDTSSAVELMGSSKNSETYYEFDSSASLYHEQLEGILIYQIDGPLFFSNAEGLKDRTRRIEFQGSVVSHPSEPIRPLNLKCIIFEMTAVTSIDATAAQVLLEIISDYRKRNVRVIFVKVRKALEQPLHDSGIIGELGLDNIMVSVDSAVETVQQEGLTHAEITA